MSDYYVAFWNLENLFDVEDSPRRSDKLERTIGNELKDWSVDILNQKISQLASVIVQMNDGSGPDLLGVCEVENEYVMNLLKDALAPLNRSYEIAHEDTKDRRGIDVGFIYDADKLTANEQFSHYIVKRTATRELFQVNFTKKDTDELLVVIGNHWPARLGGQYKSEPYRIIAGETLAYFHERIRQIHGSDVGVLAMGDFNDEPFDRSLTEHALSNHIREKVTRAITPKFYNLMWPILGERLGTYYYDYTAQVIDQFLVSKGLLTGKSNFKVVPNSVEVVRFDEMIEGTYDVPRAFGRPSRKLDREGFSDHFPIAFRLRES